MAYNFLNALKVLSPRTLFGRSLLIILMPLILVQGITTTVFVDRHWNWVTELLARRLASQIACVIEEYDRHDDHYKLTAKRFGIRVSKRKAVPALEELPKDKWVNRYLRPYLRTELVSDFELGAAHSRIIVRARLKEGWVTLSTPRKYLFSTTTPVFLIWSLCTPIVFFLIAALFMRNQIRPIRRLAELANRFGRGENVGDFRPEGAEEIKRAGVAFRVMQQRIQRQITMRTEMLAGVSHDLRTPLTRMELVIAMMKDGPEKEGLRNDIKEMTKTINAYLAFAQGEDGEIPQNTDIQGLVEEIITGFKSTHITMESALTKLVTARWRRHTLKRGLTNIIDNSLRYGKHVWVFINASKEYVYVTIEDDGPGIPTEARMDVFKPFVRVESSRNKKTGGTGLGLAIARDAITTHGGTIHLADSPKGGLAVHIKLPL